MQPLLPTIRDCSERPFGLLAERAFLLGLSFQGDKFEEHLKDLGDIERCRNRYRGLQLGRGRAYRRPTKQNPTGEHGGRASGEAIPREAARCANGPRYGHQIGQLGSKPPGHLIFCLI